MWIMAFTLVFLLLYVFSSGIAFVVIYRFPASAPKRTFGLIYAPLDWLALRYVCFRNFYNSYHNWCYTKFVANKGN